MNDNRRLAPFVVSAALLLAACGGAKTEGPLDAAVDSYVPQACLNVTSMGGGPCGCDGDCPPNGFCFTERQSGYPSGQCLTYCDADAGAPVGTVCDPIAAGEFVLNETCDATDPCRDGFACLLDISSTLGHCYATCSNDAVCVQTGNCNLYTTLCEADTSSGLGLFAACTRDAQCRSNTCVLGAGATPNFCTAYCDTRSPGCPEGATCASISSNPTETLGYCFPTCNAGSCPTGFLCAGTACLPTF